jgi:formiminoglutamase
LHETLPYTAGMNIEDFFQKVDLSRLPGPEYFEEAAWYYAFTAEKSEPLDLANKKIALIGIVEPGKEDNTSYEIRKHLYQLKRAEYAEQIVDLGDFVFDYKPKTYQSLGFALSELITMGIIPVIINGGQEITYSQYLAFAYLKKYITLVDIDARIDFNLRENEEMDSKNYLQKILMDEPSYLFHFTNIGYQSHFADTTILNFLERLFFDLHRLGDVRTDIGNMEPVLRQAHVASFDLSSIRQGDAPGSMEPTPNGFSGEEACQLCRFAGLSNTLKSFGLFSYSAENDRQGQTAHLSAQMIWYLVDGCLSRYPENPADDTAEFTKFITTVEKGANQIIFFKSKMTDRWWMEVPINEREFSGSHHIVPCAYNDYVTATKGDMPDRWWQAMKKLS